MRILGAIIKACGSLFMGQRLARSFREHEVAAERLDAAVKEVLKK